MALCQDEQYEHSKSNLLQQTETAKQPFTTLMNQAPKYFQEVPKQETIIGLSPVRAAPAPRDPSAPGTVRSPDPADQPPAPSLLLGLTVAGDV